MSRDDDAIYEDGHNEEGCGVRPGETTAPMAAVDGAGVVGPDAVGPDGVRQRRDDDFPVPSVDEAVVREVLTDPEKTLQVKSLPGSIVRWIEKQAETHGETHRTVLLRVIMHAAEARPDRVPLRIHRGQLVDLRQRTARLKKIATAAYLKDLGS